MRQRIGRAARVLFVLPVFHLALQSQPPISPVTFQPGGGAGTTSTLCRAIQIAINGDPATASNTQGPDLVLHPYGSVILVDFPQIIGNGPNQIPPGSIISSAQLQLYCTDVEFPSSTARTIRATPVLDLSQKGTWFEPATSGTSNGVNYVRRDSRPGAQIHWTGSSNAALNTSVAGPPANQVISAAFPDILSIVSVGGGGGAAVNSFHSFNITRAVTFWANGFPNQGIYLERETATGGALLVKYASDTATTASQRPRLVINFTVPPTSAPWNRVPRLLPYVPAAPITAAGQDLLLYLPAIDDDGTVPVYGVLRQPTQGALIGVFPYLTYRPDPGFSGTDSFSYTAFDAISSAFPQTVTITVGTTAGNQSLVFQDGLSPSADLSAGLTKVSHVPVDGFENGNQQTFEETVIKLHAGHRQGYIAFPNIFGAGPGKIPLGSQILDARLDLKSQHISAPSAVGQDRVITFSRIIDPLNNGPTWDWREPASLGGTNPSLEYPCANCGVSFLFPDRTQSSPSTWGFAVGTTVAQRLAIGGDKHPFDVASFRVLASDFLTDVTKSTDVTASLQAWSNGERNLGWIINQSDATTLFFWSDNAPLASNRPRLLVSFRAPGAGPLPTTVAPHADAGPDRIAYSNQTVTLNAQRTFHPNALPLFPLWLQTLGPPVVIANPLSVTPSFTAPVVPLGSRTTLEFIFAVFDGTAFSTDAVRVDVFPQPSGLTTASPVVNAGINQAVPELAVVNIIGTATGGTGPANLQHLWTQISGPPVVLTSRTSLATSFVAPTVGSTGATISLNLTVVDTGVPGGMSSVVVDQIDIRIEDVASNLAPIANAGPNRSAEPGDWIVLDGSATVDPEGQPISYSWTQLSPASPSAIGPSASFGNYVAQPSAAAVQFPFRAPIVATTTPFVFLLSATDGEDTGTSTVTVTLAPPPPSFLQGTAPGTNMVPYRDSLTASEARHLLRRLGAGWHPDDVAEVRSAGLAATVASHLSAVESNLILTEYRGPLQPQGAPLVTPWGIALSSPANIAPKQRQSFDPWPQLDSNQVEAYWLLHQFRTTAPLKERMTHFVNDRLCASSRNVIDSKRHWCVMHASMLRNGSLAPAAQAALGISQGALGDFRDLLYDFSVDAVTLSFIEGFNNKRFSPNENFGREFMELHALGIVDPVTGLPNYSQNDVVDSARAWTGYQPTVFGTGVTGQESWYPSFIPFFHDFGVKTILYQTGVFGPEDMPNIVLSYQGGVPASRFLAKGLLRHFVMNDPTGPMIEDLAFVIRQQDWNLSAILSTLLRSNAMFLQSAHKAITKSPYELANGIARTLRIPLQTGDIVGGSGVSLKILLGLAQHTISDPLDVNGFQKDTAWIDGFGALKRSEIARQLLLWARNPTSPGSTLQCSTAPPNPVFSTCGHYPYVVTGSFPYLTAAPVNLVSKFQPPANARRGLETIELLSEILDVKLQTTNGSLGSSDKAKVLQYINTQATAPAPNTPVTYSTVPFDGDSSVMSMQNKFWGVLMLMMEHPDFTRM